ncbi:MAG: hypothetical protein AB7N24_06600 [Dehalococcoidia bacterium]
MDLPSWDSRYRSPAVLRAECDAMRESISEAILTVLGESEVIGIYSHGSSLKPWATPIDYVPELSDVDVQIVLRDPATLDEDLARTFAVQAEYERLFAARVPAPLHVPRPQIMVINRELGNPEFLSGPPGTAVTLFGQPFEKVRPQPDHTFVAAVDGKTLRNDAHDRWIAGLPAHLIDRPAKFLWQPLRDMSWRISPLAPRVLSVLGAGFEEAWGQNRSGLFSSLRNHGQPEFAETYARFYLEGWAFFQSNYTDADSARRGLLAGLAALRQAKDIAGRSTAG